MKRLLTSVLVLVALSLAGCGEDRAAGDRTAASGERGYGYDLSGDGNTRAAQAPPVATEEVAQSGGTYAPGAQKQGGTATGTEGGAPAQEPVPPPGIDPINPGATLTPMLIRTGQAQLRVDSLEEGIARVRALAQRLGGIVGNTSISAGEEEQRMAQVELRIPAASFDRAISGLSPLGRVESVNVSAEDVGEEYTDVSARVANARRLESRLLDLLDRRTGRLEEMLAVEREVARVREEIERMEGRLRYLRTRVAVSTLTVTLVERSGGIGRPGDHPIRDAFREALRNFVDLIAWLIAASGILVPLALLVWLLWRARRRLGARFPARPRHAAAPVHRPPSHQEHEPAEEVR
ncbi:MAG TPA: DUF4349 domain-containing protein [Longimicrobium sp.]|nr:DUF4349 domain-containing protein [Longimicrobium sp.]